MAAPAASVSTRSKHASASPSGPGLKSRAKATAEDDIASPSPSSQRRRSPKPASDAPDGRNRRRRSPEDDANTRTAPKIVVKNEPTSPDLPANARHRPRKLELATSNTAHGPAARPSAPLTGRENGNLAMHDVGLACLSPGFQTQDPSMQQQLQRSISVRDQQRHIIESRLQRSARPVDPEGKGSQASALPGNNPDSSKALSSSKRKAPPHSLSIVPPSSEQFASERVIQSAPLNQTFTGRSQLHPLTRQVANHSSSNLSANSHIHQVPPAAQTSHRLPPISDVFAADGFGMERREAAPNSRPLTHSSYASPAHASQHQPPAYTPAAPGPASASRGRHYQSAEEAVADMSEGREDLLPKIVHYAGASAQPPTPPTPHGLEQSSSAQKAAAWSHANGDSARGHSGGARSSRRRPRAEYEQDAGTPPLGNGYDRAASRRSLAAQYASHSPESNRQKKEEFLGLCARAWDLFHST